MPTRRQIATSILSVYRRQQARAGYVLPANIVAAFSERSGWSVDETETAINYGCAEGWFEFAPPWILERSATRLGEADLNILSKLGKQGLE